MLDTVAGCAVHTTLPAGVGYTSIELKVSYLRSVHAGSGPLTAIGTVVKPGRRVAFAEGEVHDAAGRTGATADRKSTRLNSSHANISYAVFCLKKKKNTHQP